jgi:DNA-directed RNA polymerase specialized sigma24 family protein
VTDAADARNAAAVAVFADRYFSAVRAFVLAIVRNGDQADDLTQQFFVTVVLQGRLLRQADQMKGHFRPFLKQAIRNFLVDEHRRRSRLREESAERGDSEPAWNDVELAADATADADMLKTWGRNLVAMAVQRVRETCRSKNQSAHFALFEKRFLSDSDAFTSWREVGELFGLDEKTARSRALVVMERFRLTLRELIANDVGAAADVNQEIRDLIKLL